MSMSHRLEYYRTQPAIRLWRAITGYIFTTTLLIASALALLPASYYLQAWELGLMAGGDSIWSCEMPLTIEMVAAITVALLLTHEASEMGCEARLLTDIFHTLNLADSFEIEPPRWRLSRGFAPYLGVLAGIPLGCLIACAVVLLIP